MSKGQKSIEKLKRKERKVREDAPDYVKMRKVQDVLQASPGAFKAMRGNQRRLDGEFGLQTAGAEPPLEWKVVAQTLERFDFDPGAGTDYGMRLTFPYSPAQQAEVTQITTVADVAGSLNSKYFLLDSPSTDYYVWYNVATLGVDPAVAGRTGVEVALASGATAAQVATATASAIDGLALFVAPAPAANVVSVTDANNGATPDAADGAAPTGFSFYVSRQGSDGLRTLVDQIGIRPGDFIEIRESGSDAEGRQLEVVERLNAYQLRLDDVSTFGSAETDVAVRAILSGVPKASV